MSTSVTLPALGESVTEGTVTRWLKQVGDTVEADEPLLEVSTDKVDTEIPSPTAGVLLEIKAAEDETVEVGAVLAVIGDASEAGGDSGGDSDDSGSADAPAEQSQTDQAQPEPEPSSDADDEKAAEAQPAASSGGSGSGGGGGGAASGTEVTLPALGESVTEGTVTRWLKQVGDSVEADEPLLEVSTDKVDTEIPSPAAGTLLEIKVAEDETVEVGAVLAIVGEAGAEAPASEPEPAPEPEAKAAPEPEPAPEPAKEEPKPAPKPEPASAPAASSAPAATAEAPGGQDVGGYATPLVRKLATEHNVDLASVTGTGVGGRIRKQDILAAAEEAKKAAEAASAAPAASAPAAPQHRQRPRSRVRLRSSRARSAEPRRRCPGCARRSPSGWSSRCTPRPS